jgi:hypothetical protein
VSPDGPSLGLRSAGILWILLLAFGGIWLEKPRHLVPASAPATEFSAERAMQQVREIARTPHPAGSVEHGRVRDYLVAQLEVLGLKPSVQKTTSILAAYGVAATVENIVAEKVGRMSGTEQSAGPAVLLAAHYDSVPAGPGAGDDGAGVATLLETARALVAGPPLRNDVIFLFTDGEELGLLGASAFVAEHPWRNRVGVALNFDNRGTSGAVVMYETGPDNLPLMREFAGTVPAPRASSLAGAISKLMPNSSDFFVFNKAGLAGLNFAFIGGPENYHTRQDTAEHLDLHTLQHAGDYALPLARRLGEADLSVLNERGAAQAIYFNVGDREVVYPQAWARPLGIAALLLFLFVASVGVRRGAVRPGGIALALVLCLVSAIAAWRAGDWLVMSLSPTAGDGPLLRASGPFLFHPLYAVALCLLAAGFVFALWEVSGVSWRETALAGVCAWSLMAAVLAFWLPAGSYLAFWPVIFMLLALGCVFAWRGCPPAVAMVLRWLGAVPAVVLLAPLLPMLHLALGMSALGAAALALLIVMGLWLLAPLIAPGSTVRPRLAFVFLAAGAACVAVGVLTVRYDARHPRPVWLAYVMDANHSVARWMCPADPHNISLETRLDSWRRQYLTEQPQLSNFPITAGLRGSSLAWEHSAPLLELAAPEAVLLEETTKQQMRTLRIRIVSPRHATRLSIEAKAALFGSIRLNGHPANEPVPEGKAAGRVSGRGMSERESWKMLYAAPPADGLEATFVVPAGEPFDLTVADVSDGLPDIPGQTFAPRPPDLTQQHLADMTVVLKHFTF